MMFFLIIFIVIYFWIEISIAKYVSIYLGALNSFLIILFFSLYGIYMFKKTVSVFIKRSNNFEIGDNDENSSFSSFIIHILGSIFLILPGYLTGFIGILLFIPGIDLFISNKLTDYFKRKIFSRNNKFNFFNFYEFKNEPYSDKANVIEGSYKIKKKEKTIEPD